MLQELDLFLSKCKGGKVLIQMGLLEEANLMAQYVWEPFLLTPDDRNRSSF
jgi:hypothetical protein